MICLKIEERLLRDSQVYLKGVDALIECLVVHVNDGELAFLEENQ